ncbi:hypothetical protein MTO96_023116 [Rhipicephalus appendiculatus]
MSPRSMVVPLLLLFFAGVRFFLETVNVDKAIPTAKGSLHAPAPKANSLQLWESTGTNESVLNTSSLYRHTRKAESLELRESNGTLESVFNTTCPSENELRTEHHFRSWDEKLEQALRLSGQGPPKTEEEAWQAVTDHIHVFTAFVATTTVHAIHITAFVRNQKANATRTFTAQPPLVCIIRTSNRITVRKARIRLVWTWFNPIFWNALILCRPPTEVSTASEDIRVAVAVKGADEDSWRWLQLHHPPERLEQKCCAVCVRPIFGSSLSLWKVVEFVTHYRTLGARRFYFYDLDMSSGVKLLLARLQSSGVAVTLVPFKLIASTDHVHGHGQMPALYDCMFRSMSTTEYYIHVDFDELIVPARHNSIPALVQEVERRRKDVGSLIVSNRYMCAEYPLNVQYTEHKYLPLQTRLFTYHSKDISHFGFTKIIGRSKAICEAAVHAVAQHCVGYTEILSVFRHGTRMASAARPCVQVSSVDELPNPDGRPPRTKCWPLLLVGHRMSPRSMVVPLLLLFFSGVRFFLETVNVDKAIPPAKGSLHAPAPKANSLQLWESTGTNETVLNTTCPSENELRSEHHFRSWDEKLEQGLRLSGQGPPKTEEEAWHAVTDHIHVFTAFVAPTKVHAIHITALVRVQKANATRTFTAKPPLVCIISTSNRKTVGKARIRLVWTWFNPVFWNALILCRPPTKESTASEDIRVAVAVKGADEDSWRWLQLHHPPERLEQKCCAVCVRPMFGSKTSLWKLVEFVTHYRTLGARRFYFYDLDMSSGVKLLLARLQSSGVDVTLVPFKLIASTHDVHAYGQMPALYDCIFRSMSTTEYFIHVDLDELIVPARHNSIPALVQEVERKRNNVGSLIVSNRFMCAEYPLNVQYTEYKYLPLQTRLFTYHSRDISAQAFTKIIGRSKAICQAAVHAVAQHCLGYTERMSPRSIVVLLLFFFPGVLLFLESVNVHKAIPAAKGSLHPHARKANSLRLWERTGTNESFFNTTCPSENELRTEHHFRSWDEKLEQGLRLSGQGPPKTEEEAWHAVTDDIHVFTAFVATTTVHAIHITALVRGQKANAKRNFTAQPPLVCIIRTSKRITVGKARIRLVWTWSNPIFRDAFILCRPPTEVSTASEDIRVAVAVKGANEDSWRWLQLHHQPAKLEEKCCAVCVKAIFGSKRSLWKLVEFVTHYRTLGARRFYFYDLDMSSGVKLLLARLQSSGVDVTLVPFKLIASPLDVHQVGQMPALYDCIFRSMSTTEYFIHVDLDELIVPARHNSIPALVQEVERKRKDVGSLVVSHRYVCAEYPINVQYTEHKYLPLQTRLFPYHSKDISDSGFTKIIGRSKAICEAAVHTVARHCVGYREVMLHSSVAFMKHYKSCCDFGPEHAVHKFIRVWDFPWYFST